MRLVRFTTKDKSARYGVVDDTKVYELTGDILGTWQKSGQSYDLDAVQLLAPVVPSNMLAIGQNYKAHVEEGNDKLPTAPLMFLKSTSCLNHPGSSIVLPKAAPSQVDYEAELAVVIKKSARNVAEEEALDYVLGYSCANDVSARDCQRNDGQWARGKSFDTFGPIGPWIETDLNPSSLNIYCRINGQTFQSSNTSLMIFDVPYIISYLSSGMTLLPGTVIMTGTPSGCGFARTPLVYLKTGDVVEVEIEGIGILRNSVSMES
jgi:2-keto-4-pentenoate hydratase/2-oxohepta-3-ene-1,7-dioic acid hydratase in catechol pathway